MTAINANNNTFAPSNVSTLNRSDSSAQIGPIVLLASLIAMVRTAMVIVAALTLGGAARYFFPEMFAIPSSPVALLAIVGIDTFAIAAGVLTLRARSSEAKLQH